MNVPFTPGAGDREYLAAFLGVVAPVLRSYEPELILLSAGFDAHHRDPLGGMSVTADGYEQMLRILMELADESCSGRVILTLEGGYDLEALRESVERVLSCLSFYEPTKESLPPSPPLADLHPQAAQTLKAVVAAHRKYWPDLPPI